METLLRQAIWQNAAWKVLEKVKNESVGKSLELSCVQMHEKEVYLNGGQRG